MSSIVILTGPTASGKSAVANALSRILPVEIISADSVQVYKGFDIGSAKPSAAERAAVPHHLISVLDPEETFDAGKFCALADSAIRDIQSRGRLPLVVGGTGLYISALLGGLVQTGPISDSAQAELEQFEEKHRLQGMSQSEVSQAIHQRLSAIDSLTAKALLPTDYLRVKRALLVALSSGKSLRTLQDSHKHEDRRYQALVFCILPERKQLYRAIDSRVDRMMSEGLVDEVRELLALHSEYAPGFRAIGYRHVCAWLRREISEAQMLETMKQDTRRFAKRQYTWWRHQPQRLQWELVSANDVPTLQNSFSARQLSELIGKEVAKVQEVSGRRIKFWQIPGIDLESAP